MDLDGYKPECERCRDWSETCKNCDRPPGYCTCSLTGDEPDFQDCPGCMLLDAEPEPAKVTPIVTKRKG